MFSVLSLGWNIGCILMVLLAYLIRDWSYLQLSFAVASVSLASIYILIPESPRWLLKRGEFNKVSLTEFKCLTYKITEGSGVQLMAFRVGGVLAPFCGGVCVCANSRYLSNEYLRDYATFITNVAFCQALSHQMVYRWYICIESILDAAKQCF